MSCCRAVNDHSPYLSRTSSLRQTSKSQKKKTDDPQKEATAWSIQLKIYKLKNKQHTDIPLLQICKCVSISPQQQSVLFPHKVK